MPILSSESATWIWKSYWSQISTLKKFNAKVSSMTYFADSTTFTRLISVTAISNPKTYLWTMIVPSRYVTSGYRGALRIFSNRHTRRRSKRCTLLLLESHLRVLLLLTSIIQRATDRACSLINLYSCKLLKIMLTRLLFTFKTTKLENQ